MLKYKSICKFKTWDKKQYVYLARKNSVHFLCKSSSKFFYLDRDKVRLNKNLEKYMNNKTFLSHVKDAINFRAEEFYRSIF